MLKKKLAVSVCGDRPRGIDDEGWTITADDEVDLLVRWRQLPPATQWAVLELVRYATDMQAD